VVFDLRILLPGFWLSALLS